MAINSSMLLSWKSCWDCVCCANVAAECFGGHRLAVAVTLTPAIVAMDELLSWLKDNKACHGGY